MLCLCVHCFVAGAQVPVAPQDTVGCSVMLMRSCRALRVLSGCLGVLSR